MIRTKHVKLAKTAWTSHKHTFYENCKLDTSNIRDVKHSWLPAMPGAKFFFFPEETWAPVSGAQAGNSYTRQEGSIQRRAAQQPSKENIQGRILLQQKVATWANTTLVSGAFQIPRRSWDEDTRGVLVTLIGNLRRTPRSVRIEQTVHRLKPARERTEQKTDVN